MSAYAELAVTTNFSFLRGASHPQEMVATADELGCFAIGIADRNSFAGVVRAYDEAKNRKIKLIVGVRLVTTDGFEVLAYPTDRAAYGRLCKLLTVGNRKAKKGECHLTFEEIVAASEGQMFIAMPPLSLFDRHPPSRYVPARAAAGLEGSPKRERSGERRPFQARCARASGGRRDILPPASPPSPAPRRAALSSPACHYHRGDEPRRLGLAGRAWRAHRRAARCRQRRFLSRARAPAARRHASPASARNARWPKRACGLPSMPSGTSNRRRRWRGCSRTFPMRSPARSTIAKACNFSLGQLKYEYPDEPVPEGKTAQQHLADLTWAGARERYPKDKYPDGIPADVEKRLE